MKILHLFLLMLFPHFAVADSLEWTPRQEAVGALALGATAVDFMQTEWIVKHDRQCAREPVGTCRYYMETNPIIGRPLTKTKAALWFGLGVPVEALIGNELPGEYRTAYLAWLAGLELYRDGHNYNIGMRFAF